MYFWKMQFAEKDICIIYKLFYQRKCFRLLGRIFSIAGVLNLANPIWSYRFIHNNINGSQQNQQKYHHTLTPDINMIKNQSEE